MTGAEAPLDTGQEAKMGVDLRTCLAPASGYEGPARAAPAARTLRTWGGGGQQRATPTLTRALATPATPACIAPAQRPEDPELHACR